MSEPKLPLPAEHSAVEASDRPERDRETWERPWVYLIWLAFLLLPLRGSTLQSRWATGFALAAFLVIYLWSFRSSGPRLWLSRAAIFTIGVVVFPYNAFAHTFFIYAGAPALRANATESVILMLGTIAASYTYLTLHNSDGLYFGLVSVIVIGVGAMVLSARASRAASVVLANKDVEIGRLAKLAERERIARDLHDLLGHTLVAIAIKAELAGKLAARDMLRARTEMNDVASVARRTLDEVRLTISGLRKIGLRDAVNAAEGLLRDAGIEVERSMASLPTLSAMQEHAIAHAVLEAVTNVIKHSGARHATIRVTSTELGLEVAIDDDGRGGFVTPGGGLTGMRERLRVVGGRLTITQKPVGLCLTIALSLESGRN